MKDNKLTYISLFSSAGVGCYGFKKENFECIATNEIIQRRLDIQRINQKCKFASGYISGDIQDYETKDAIFNEIKKWETMGNDEVDVVIATPPCQGMSVANHKKKSSDLQRNSLIVESVDLIREINPKIFIFENVSSFWKTGCTRKDGTIVPIGEMIQEDLAKEYLISHRIVNFKNYGSNSSRTRTLVIGTRKDLSDVIVPLELFPDYVQEKTLGEIIGDMPNLEWGSYDKDDFYHSFRTYPQRMRKWISDLQPGESAFDNTDPEKIPHRVVDGKIVFNKAKNADKYKRQRFDKVGPCIHTRNDQLASQNTIHPVEDRVFSIRELMKLMSIPEDFQWLDLSLDQLNALSDEDKKKISKKNEMNIRQSIGEAVPTIIFSQIAKKIKRKIQKSNLKDSEIFRLIDENSLNEKKNLVSFLNSAFERYSISTILRLIEMSNTRRQENSAFYTNRFIIQHIMDSLPDFKSKDTLVIVEPSVGAGNFLELLYKKYEDKKKVELILVDIDNDILDILKEINNVPDNFKIRYINNNFLDIDFKDQDIDLVIGNPPFTKMNKKQLDKYIDDNLNKDSKNLAEYFFEKSINIASYVSLIMPKNFLNTQEFSTTRSMATDYSIDNIIDFGELGFSGVLIETINIMIDTRTKKKSTIVQSIPQNQKIVQKTKYITDNTLPYWVIYRDSFFDRVAQKMEFNIFDVFRDRQITKNNSTTIVETDKDSRIRVLKSRNISDDGQRILDIDGYDSYMDSEYLSKLTVSNYLDRDDVYMTPNMTYKPRVMKKKKGYITNGSIAILIPKKKDIYLNKKQRLFFSTEEYRKFYSIARNRQTRSLNIDKTSVFWFGKNTELQL